MRAGRVAPGIVNGGAGFFGSPIPRGGGAGRNQRLAERQVAEFIGERAEAGT